MRRPKGTVLIFLLMCLTFYSRSISQTDTSILLVHSRNDSGIIRSECISAYHIYKGEVIFVDTIIRKVSGGDDKIDSRLSVGLNDELIKNRYLYTSIGLLIDIKEKKVLLEDPGNFVKETNDTLFFTPSGSWNNFILNGYYLKSHRIKTILKRPFENNLRLISPDYKYALSISYSDGNNRKIYLIDKKKNKKPIVPELGKGPLLYGGTHAFGRIPVKWISNDEFIYLKYVKYNQKGAVWEKPQKQTKDTSAIIFSELVADTLPCCSGEFRIYNILNNTDKLIAFTDSLYAPSIEDKFLDIESAIVLRNIGFSYLNYWQIMPGDSTLRKYSFSSSFKTTTDTSYHPKGFDHRRNIVSYKDKVIGSFYGQDFEEINETFAAYGKLESKGKSYLLIWNADSKEWFKSEISGFLGFLAFFNKSW